MPFFKKYFLSCYVQIVNFLNHPIYVLTFIG